jgi:hypothetical protein
MRTKYFVSLYTSVVITEEYNVMVNSEELIGTTEYLTQYARCRIQRCRYNRVRLYIGLGYRRHRMLSLTSVELKRKNNWRHTCLWRVSFSTNYTSATGSRTWAALVEATSVSDGLFYKTAFWRSYKRHVCEYKNLETLNIRKHHLETSFLSRIEWQICPTRPC